MAVKNFVVPDVGEVVEYIAKKHPEWPERFCDYYGNRFWNHYQSCGWKVGGRAAMKCWQSAINGQWANLKYKEDVDMLAKFTVKKSTVVYSSFKPFVATNEPADRTVEYMDEVLVEYVRHPTEVHKDRLAACYDWLKERRLIRINQEQKEIAVKAGTEDINKGKAAIVKFVFEGMAMNLITFNQLVYGT